MILKLDSLGCGYNKTIVYANTAFSEGINIISASSGTGKSTFLKTIALLINPLQGKIIFNEKYITKRDNFWSSDCILLSQGNFFLSEKVIDTLMAPFEFNAHKNKKFDLTEVSQLLDFFELKENFLKRKTEELSGGQKQRIALIRVLILKPSIVLLDEPTTGLDLNLTRKTFVYLKEYCKKRICIIVSHETTAFDFANRITKIENGVLNG